jgi:hypothetical protein
MIPDQVARLRKALEFCKDNPEEHDQRYWAAQTPYGCGTTMCLAGTVLHQAGYEFVWRDSAYDLNAAGNPTAARAALNGGPVVDIQREAQRLLGISNWAVHRLFTFSATIRDLYMIAQLVTDGEIEIPIDVNKFDNRKYPELELAEDR